MSDKIRKYKVSILSESYFLVSDESEEHIKDAAQFVDNYFRQIAKKCPEIELKRLAVLVSLQLASKILKSQDVVDLYELSCNKFLNLISNEIKELDAIDESRYRI